MRIHYLEIVTPDIAGVCETYAQTQGLHFGEPDAALGGARTASVPGGGMVGVRGPLRESEAPIVRHYAAVADIALAVETAQASGAIVALPPMPLPGHGQCAIVIQGGVEMGFWQLEE